MYIWIYIYTWEEGTKARKHPFLKQRIPATSGNCKASGRYNVKVKQDRERGNQQEIKQASKQARVPNHIYIHVAKRSRAAGILWKIDAAENLSQAPSQKRLQWITCNLVYKYLRCIYILYTSLNNPALQEDLDSLMVLRSDPKYWNIFGSAFASLKVPKNVAHLWEIKPSIGKCDVPTPGTPLTQAEVESENKKWLLPLYITRFHFVQ